MTTLKKPLLSIEYSDDLWHSRRSYVCNYVRIDRKYKKFQEYIFIFHGLRAVFLSQIVFGTLVIRKDKYFFKTNEYYYEYR